MKKLFAMVMAVAAISFASCGNKTEKAECEDTTACECKCDTCKCDPCQCAEQKCCGECPVKALSEKLEAGDAEGLNAALTEAQEKIQALVAEGKVEEAQKVGSAIKEFIETNKEKLGEAQITVDNIVSTITGIPAAAEATAEAGVEAVKADANAAAEAGKAAAEQAANQAVEAGKAEANKQIDKGVDAAKKKLGL